MRDLSRPTPLSDRFVVKAPPGPARSELATLGKTQELRNNLIVIEFPHHAGPAKERWKNLLRAMEGLEWAAPVLEDETAQTHVPTGEVTVRFKQKPSNTDLARFAKAHGLTLRDRNEFEDTQVAFKVAKPRETYLPELIEELNKAAPVRRAWANTMTSYRRI